MHWWSLSVCLSVPCLTLCREWKGMTSWKLTGRMMTCDPIQSSKVQGWGNFDVAQLVFYRDINVQWTISVLKALGGYSIYHLQGVGTYGVLRSTGRNRTACFPWCRSNWSVEILRVLILFFYLISMLFSLFTRKGNCVDSQEMQNSLRCFDEKIIPRTPASVKVLIQSHSSQSTFPLTSS